TIGIFPSPHSSLDRWMRNLRVQCGGGRRRRCCAWSTKCPGRKSDPSGTLYLASERITAREIMRPRLEAEIARAATAPSTASPSLVKAGRLVRRQRLERGAGNLAAIPAAGSGSGLEIPVQAGRGGSEGAHSGCALAESRGRPCRDHGTGGL